MLFIYLILWLIERNRRSRVHPKTNTEKEDGDSEEVDVKESDEEEEEEQEDVPNSDDENEEDDDDIRASNLDIEKIMKNQYKPKGMHEFNRLIRVIIL